MRRKPVTINTMTTPKPVADQLREAIRASGRDIKSIAKDADIAYSAVHGFVNKPDKRIQTETAEALANALGMTLILKRR